MFWSEIFFRSIFPGCNLVVSAPRVLCDEVRQFDPCGRQIVFVVYLTIACAQYIMHALTNY
jgi:hypothetical protein